MAKSQKKSEARLDKRIDAYEETIKRVKSGASAFHRPGSQKKVY